MSFYYNEPVLSFDDIFRLFDSDGQYGGRRGGQHTHGSQHRGRGVPSEHGGRSGFQPKMDVYESQEQNLVTAVFELPGIAKEALNLDVNPQNGRLTVSGELVPSYAPKEGAEHGWVHRELPSGRFSRTIPLPAGTEASDVNAKLENGLLVITFPKTSKQQEPQKITIA